MEHPGHVGDLGDVPRVNAALVKAGLAAEERAHVGDGGDVPRRDRAESLARRRGVAGPLGQGVVQVRPGAETVLPPRRVLRLEAVVDGHVWAGARVERHRVALDEGVGPEEHVRHANGPAHIPPADVLVHSGSLVECRVEARDLPDLPRAEGLVEASRGMEHPFHVGDLGDVPRVDAALVKAGHAGEEPVHVGHGGDVPRRDRAESLARRRGVAGPLGHGALETGRVWKRSLWRH
eukprot:scaffold65162_cov51-Phaeocystis_antarctica.AAC.1